MVNQLTLARTRVQSLDTQLGALDPRATLQRGFSVVQRADTKRVVASKEQVGQGDALTITVADGVIPATAGAAKGKTAPVKKRHTVPQETGMRQLL